MVYFANQEQVVHSSNANNVQAEKMRERKENVPYVWLFINHMQIDKYIRDKLTNANGTIKEQEYGEDSLPFFCEILKEKHPHLYMLNPSGRKVYSRVLSKGEGQINYDFVENEAMYYSLKALRRFYFNKDTTLVLKNRILQNGNDKTSDSTIKQLASGLGFNLLKDEKKFIQAEMYCDSIIKLTWDGVDAAPEWYYPYPISDLDMAKAKDHALNLISEYQVSQTMARYKNTKIKSKTKNAKQSSQRR